MNPAEHKAEILKILRSMSYRHDLYRVFSDSMEMIALATANTVDLAQFASRETRYMEVIKPYSKEEITEISRILPHLVAAFDIEFSDYLGQIYMELEMGNDARGQFFTPYHLSRLAARLTLDESIEQKIAERGFVTLQEPAVGSGGMVIAMAEAMREREINYQQHCHVTCVDVDIKTVHMAFIQLSIIGMPATIVHGNTLSLEVWSHWYTPFHILHGWGRKLRHGRSAIVYEAPKDVPTTLINAPAKMGGQMELSL